MTDGHDKHHPQAAAPTPGASAASTTPDRITAGPRDPHSAAPLAEPTPTPTATPVPVSSGDPRVDDALSRLAELEDLPLADQVEVFSDIHRRLAGVLADPDSQA